MKKKIAAVLMVLVLLVSGAMFVSAQSVSQDSHRPGITPIFDMPVSADCYCTCLGAGCTARPFPQFPTPDTPICPCWG